MTETVSVTAGEARPSATAPAAEAPAPARPEGRRKRRRRRFDLRTRVLMMFALGALLLSALLAAAAYSFTRSSMVSQRERSGTEQAYRNAQIVQNELAGGGATPGEVINRLQALGVTRSAINVNGAWASSSARFDSDSFSMSLQERVIVDGEPARMITDAGGETGLIVGIPLTVTDAAYFEFISLEDAENLLDNVLGSLLLGGVITTMIGGLIGWLAASRAVRPLGEAAQAAKAIAGGKLGTRLEATDDQDLRVLANAFNDMASALQERVERDARFASDVSHELRSPLMTLAASAQVMQARRDEMPDRAQAALDLLIADVARFQGLVEDLLEISRFDAGAVRLHHEDLVAAEFVRQAVAVSSLPESPVLVDPDAEGMIISGDRRRLARVIANLIDNARIHGDGDATISVSASPAGRAGPLAHVYIAVEDHGPGVPPEERTVIFERFARGGAAGRRAASDGAGLGLALVDEHVRMHGGRLWVDDRADGEPGARFVIELPAAEPGA
jgi:two-component system, OmpR family, sensor histidine kinase MtrB